MIPLTTSGTTKDNLFWIYRQVFLIIIILIFVTSALDNYVVPLLEAWEDVIDIVITREDSLLNTTIEQEIEVFTERTKIELANTDWESMTQEQKETRIYDVLDNVDEIQEQLFGKLWGIVLVVSLPILTIPLLIWLGLKLVLWFYNLIVRLVARVFKVNPDLKFYWKGKEIFKPKEKKTISKKFEQIVDEEIEKCSCLYHEQKHINCDDFCNCRIMKAD